MFPATAILFQVYIRRCVARVSQHADQPL